MNFFVVSLLCVVTLASYVADALRLPSSLKLLPEMCSAIALVVVVARVIIGTPVRLDENGTPNPLVQPEGPR